MYRGYSLNKRRWIFGSLVEKQETMLCPLGITKKEMDDNIRCYIISNGFSDWNMPIQLDWNEVDKNSIGKRLEKRDKNGNFIYENDIIKITKNNSEKIGIIVYEDDSFCVRINKDDTLILKNLNSIQIEIIGNKYADFNYVPTYGEFHDN